ncbi:radical SAM protein [Candidatus Termititenax persephonae]|uniref:Radical SAM protein n=1 Tax=Candidatus Termititenax persephonae TaxID=2218525 RepID=A0A388TJ34_9BACT|nr:radical SAM protein [Candidatus Termititenax persephonae]
MWRPKFENLELGAFCELLCPDCPAWQERPPSPISTDLKSWLINLTDGNPWNHPGINQLLAELKTKKHFVALTTCGYNLADQERQLLLVDLVLLYVPAYSRERAVFQAGFNPLDRQISAIEHLQEINKKFAVLYPIDSETIEDLPDLYQKLNRPNSYLILLYNKRADLPLQRVDKKYLHYYGRRHNTLAYEYSGGGRQNCLDFARQLARPSLYNLWTMLKLFYKLYW